MPIIARARDLEASGRLLETGAAQAFPEMVESSLRQTANAIEIVGVPQGDVHRLLEGVRATRCALVRGTTDVDRR